MEDYSFGMQLFREVVVESRPGKKRERERTWIGFTRFITESELRNSEDNNDI